MDKQPRSSGFLILCRSPKPRFLLMKHADRLDLPKGHVDPGETDLEAAFRELEEETGILKSEVEHDASFCFENRYPVSAGYYTGEANRTVTKTLLVFLGYIDREKPIQLTEHPGYLWVDWDPPHKLQANTIDPLLAQLASHLAPRQ